MNAQNNTAMKITNYEEHASKHQDTFNRYMNEFSDCTMTELGEYVERARRTMAHHRTHSHLYTEGQRIQLPLKYWAAKMTLRAMYEANGWDASRI